MEKAEAEIIQNVKSVGVPLEEEVAQEQEAPRLSEMEDSQAKYILDFAKANYKRIISPNGKQIKINGEFHTMTKITEDLEEDFNKLELKLNTVNQMDSKAIREALYNFITFATNVSLNDLKNCDRGELKSIALILGMRQKGFRDI